MEVGLYTVLHSADDRIKPPIRASFTTFDCLDNDNALCHGLLKHVMIGVSIAPAYHRVSVVSDTAPVRGLSLDAGAL